jgi:hypothetical protein
VDKSVSFSNNYSTSSSMSPIISEPKLMYTLYKQTTAFLLTYEDLWLRLLEMADANGSMTPLCIMREISLNVRPLKYSL